jgi:hypothetical protein
MPDNVSLKDAAGATFVGAAKEIDGVKVQRTQVTVGGSGVSADVSDTNPMPITPGVLSYYLFVSGGGTVNTTNAKASAGKLRRLHFTNRSGVERWLKFWDKSTQPVPATDTSTLRLMYRLPPGGSLNLDVDVSFLSGIGVGVVANPETNDASFIGGWEVVGMVYFQ